MQVLWSKLLSGEATKPRTYSKRTIDFISSIDKKDADLFTKMCTFVCCLTSPELLIYDSVDEVYNKNQINFSELKHLDSLGLISFEPVSGYKVRKLPKQFIIYYYGRLTEVECPNDGDNNIDIGKAMLTNMGKELIAISGGIPDEEFYNYMCSRLLGQGLILSSIISAGRSF